MKIKICGLRRTEDIEAVNEAAPDLIGFVFAKGSRRYVTAEEAALLRRELCQGISAAGVFVNEDLDAVLELTGKGIIDMVQLHGSEDVQYMERLKRYCNAPVIKAVSMTSGIFSEELQRWEQSSVDYLLLDSGAGGTGEQFDYRLIGRITKPFFLAGGLNPKNVAEAAGQIMPYGLI